MQMFHVQTLCSLIIVTLNAHFTWSYAFGVFPENSNLPACLIMMNSKNSVAMKVQRRICVRYRLSAVYTRVDHKRNFMVKVIKP